MNIGQQLSHYIIEDKLGDGGFGDVFRARDIGTGIDVAIKCSRPGDSKQLPDQQQRFMREVACSSKLRHPNIVQVYEYGALSDGTLYLVMEFVCGKNLEDLIKQSAPFSFSYACQIVLQILNALTDAHANAIIHRDLKPANIMIMRQGTKDIVKLLDFGIAKAFDGTQPDLTQQFFQNSVGFGTPQYMPPEQFYGKNLGPHTDLYAIGLVFYEMLTGHQAFSGKTLSEIIQKQLKDFPDIPKPFHEGPLLNMFRMALAKDVTMRYVHAADMAADIRNILQAGGHWLRRYDSFSSNRPKIDIPQGTVVLQTSNKPADTAQSSDLSSFNTIIVERVLPEMANSKAPHLPETVIYDSFEDEDNLPTDDMSQLNPALIPPTLKSPVQQPGVPHEQELCQSAEFQVATQAVRMPLAESMPTQDMSRLELKGNSEVSTLMVQNGGQAMPPYLQGTGQGSSDNDNPPLIFHQQRTAFLKSRQIDSRLSRDTVLGFGSLWHRLMISRPALWLRTSRVGQSCISMTNRIHRVFHELYERHFGALVICICLSIILFALLIVILIVI